MKQSWLVGLDDYPYNAKKASCNNNAKKLPQKIQSTTSNSLSGNEESLKKVLVNIGPVVVYIQVTESFYNYNKGIYWEQKCPSSCNQINHAVVLVGYGTDTTSYKTPVDYWIVKNSWGKQWGDSGYIRMIRGYKGMNNNCNIACYIRYAVV